MRNVDAAGLGIGDDYPPRIMGVLNVSRESPYDPSVFNDAEAAAEYVDRELIDRGADIVDVGLESANKRFEVLSAEGELDRLDTAIDAIERVSGDAVFSIETRYHEVAEAALDAGFHMVNDICGFADPKMPEVCEAFDAAVIKMASPPDLERPGAVEEVDDIYEALRRNGLTDKTIVDPAFGGWSEAKTLEHDRETFHRLREFRALDRPMLVSINRKNFLRDVAGRSTEEALPVSLAATSMAVERGVHVIRTHDVAETRDAALIGAEFARRCVRSGAGDDEHAEKRAGRHALEELDITTVREAARHIDRIGGETATAGNAVSRIFELTGLTPEERGALRAAAAETGVFVVGDTSNASDTNDSSQTGETATLLIGTPAAFENAAAAAGGVSPSLDATMERIIEAAEYVPA